MVSQHQSRRCLCIVIAVLSLSVNSAAGQSSGGSEQARKQAYSHYAAGNYLVAVEAASVAIRADDKDMRLYYVRGGCHFYLGDMRAAVSDFDHYLRSSPDDVNARYSRGVGLLWLKRLDEALHDFEFVVTQAPNNADALTCLGIIECHHSRYDRAVERFDEALAVEPHKKDALYARARAYQNMGLPRETLADVALLVTHHLDQQGGFVGLPEDISAQLGKDAVAHGIRQMERLFVDCPAMMEGIRDSDPMVVWLGARFAGGNLGFLVDWDPEPPKIADAAHWTRDQRGFIRVSRTHIIGPNKGLPLSCDELWCSVAFEMFNLQNTVEFRTVFEKARNSQIGRANFLRRLAELEFLALQRTRAFYVLRFEPWARSVGFQTAPEGWNILLPLSFDSWIGQYHEDGYPEVPYGAYYDAITNNSKEP